MMTSKQAAKAAKASRKQGQKNQQQQDFNAALQSEARIGKRRQR